MGMFRFKPNNNQNATGKMNAMTMAYQTVYNKLPINPIRRQFNNTEKLYHGMFVDSELDNKWLDDLNNIDEVEITSVCSGHDADRISHVIFKPINQDVYYLEQIVNTLNNNRFKTKSMKNIGMGGHYRICVATRNWYVDGQNNDSWRNWWQDIATRIKKAVAN